MALLDLSGVVNMLGNYSVSVARPSAAGFVNGIASSTSFTTSTLSKCSVQPLRGQELDRWSEGNHATEWIRIYAPTESPNDAIQVGDRVTVQNWRASGTVQFQVEHVDSWPNTGAYVKVIAKALNAQEPRL